jgi:hypothetical protein
VPVEALARIIDMSDGKIMFAGVET